MSWCRLRGLRRRQERCWLGLNRRRNFVRASDLDSWSVCLRVLLLCLGFLLGFRCGISEYLVCHSLKLKNTSLNRSAAVDLDSGSDQQCLSVYLPVRRLVSDDSHCVGKHLCRSEGINGRESILQRSLSEENDLVERRELRLVVR